MKCLRCGNTDPAYFYQGSKGVYCRKCIRFSRILLEEEPESFSYEVAQGSETYTFGFELTALQKVASKRCLEALEESDVLLYCVCGAGKTEISVESISAYLSKGLKVAYAIARKEVVKELEKRFAAIFPSAKVVAVYGGHHEQLNGDLIVCTCHQLYRYYQTFDLLIIDEADAYPLKGNETLMNIAINAARGRIIFSSATTDDNLQRVLKKRPYQKVELYVRPSGRPLSVPRLIYLNSFFTFFCLYRLMALTANRCIIFVTSRKMCKLLYMIYKRFFPCTYVYSDLKEREKNIAQFRKGKYRFIFSTTVLERGITIMDIDVIILDLDDRFDHSSLVQMLGRVGRGLSSKGSSYIITGRYSKAIRQTMAYLKEANAHCEMSLL